MIKINVEQKEFVSFYYPKHYLHTLTLSSLIITEAFVKKNYIKQANFKRHGKYSTKTFFLLFFLHPSARAYIHPSVHPPTHAPIHPSIRANVYALDFHFQTNAKVFLKCVKIGH